VEAANTTGRARTRLVGIRARGPSPAKWPLPCRKGPVSPIRLI